MLLLLPVVMAAGGWGISSLSKPLSRMHATVRLAERVHLEETGEVTDTIDASDAFRGTGGTTGDLYDEARDIREDFAAGGWWLGGFLGLVVVGKLIMLSIRWRREDYTAQQAGCVACGRCYEFCPREKLRLAKKGTANELEVA